MLIIPMAVFCLAAVSAAIPISAYSPSPETAALRVEPKASADDIEILTSSPSDGVLVLGDLSVNGGPNASLHELMVQALNVAASKGADFVALAKPDGEPMRFLGKMVPVGHGRSMFVAGPLKGSEVNRIASIPGDRPGSIRVVLGRYAR